MAEEHHQKSHEYEPTVSEGGAVQTKERGLFDFLGKKEEDKPKEEVIATESEKVQVSEPEPKVEEEKKPGLMEKLHRFGGSSSSAPSDEEGEEGEEKEKKKKEEKGLKEMISGEKEEEKHEDTSVPVEQIDAELHQEQANSQKKKGLLDKIKEKLVAQHKKADEVTPPPPAETATVEAPPHQGEAGQDLDNPEEKKGLVDKIKEKVSGQHNKVPEAPPLPPTETATVEAPSHEGEARQERTNREEKKGILDKIKEKLSGQHKKADEVPPAPPAETATIEEPSHEGEARQEQGNCEEKKGILDKIKEKLSGQYKKADEVPLPPPAETATVEAPFHGGEAHQEQTNSEEKNSLLDKIKEKLSGQHKKADEVPPPSPAEAATVEAPSHEGEAHQERTNSEEKKGLLDKIKEKLSGQHKKDNEVPPPPPAETTTVEGEVKEKKGLLEKIKEKLPGYHPKTEEEKETERFFLPVYNPKYEGKKERKRITLRRFLHPVYRRISLRRFLLPVYQPKTEEEKEREGNLIRRRNLPV